jgi:predicted nuclease of predicted toxin-antitoxin system
MRFLANENLPLDVVEAIRSVGHDVAWIRTDAPGIKDHEVLARALNEKRVLLTFDKDFGELAYRFGLPPDCGIVLFRVHANSPSSAREISRCSDSNSSRLDRPVLCRRV